MLAPEMAAKPSRIVGLHAAIVLFMCWSNARTCVGIKKDPRSQFYDHAVVQPTLYTATREKRDLESVKMHNEEKLTLGFVAFDRNFILELKMNKDLLPKHYFEKHHENGNYITRLPMQEDSSHCHYKGRMLGVQHSWAAISTCNGISGVIYDGQEMHYIEPDHKAKNSSHLVFRDSDLKPENLHCGVRDSSFPNRSRIMEELKRNRRSTVLQDPYKSNRKSRFVELIIVNDNKEFKEFNEDKNAVFERSKEIANIVNGLYSPLNVYIALVGVIVWSDHDEIKLSPDGDATLTNFLHYRRERLAQEHPNDNAQLITAMTFDGGVVGKALKGPICTYEYSGGVNMDHSHVVGLVATTVSHELGHNFGMEHDTDECQCPDDKCIMSPSSSSTSPRRWSSCSLEYLELAYSQGMDYCLKNRPTDIIGPVCGNGFLEEGEECDCGLKEFCSNHCCNATTCELYSNATCAVGGCCDTETCQVKKVATLCRDSASECDLPEFCDGVSEFCPSDIFRQNGEECGNGKAYCYDGRCQSHLDQCRLLWGQTGKMSDLRCYEQNYKGNVNGNCGYNRINSTYKACRKDDILCGMLHCTHLNERLEFGMESAAILARSFINVRGKIFTCRSAIVDLGLFNTDPGLAPNGAKCGEGKACVNQKCVPVSSMRKNDCPYDCSGNGVCNSRGNCHCELGYAPPYCDSPGPGGSIDSGPASDPSSYFIVIAMYVIFLGLLPLMVLASAGIYYYRNHLKNWWSRKAHKANIKSRAKTTTQRKLQPPSKFQFDRNSIRTLEISAPLPVSSSVNCAVSTLPAQTSHNLADSSGFSEVQISSPVPQNSGTLQSNKFTPVRPAPPRPDNTPQRTPSWTPATAVITPTIVRTSSLRSPCESSVGNRPLSTSGFRPTCPPPRPPPPKLNSSSLLQQDLSSYTYEDIPKSKEHERSVTPSSTYYDDCQTLDFTDTPLAFVHMSKQNNVKDSKINDVSYHKQNNCAASEHISTDVNKINNRTNKTFNINNQSVGACKPVFPRVVRTGETSLVASLAQKFEKQDSSNTCDSLSNSLRPPFKSRPLPPRPDNPRA